MTEALDVVDACRRLARIVVPQLADLCAVDVLDRPGAAASQRLAVAARDEADEQRLRDLVLVRDYRIGRGSDTGRVLAGDEPLLVSDPPRARRGAPSRGRRRGRGLRPAAAPLGNGRAAAGAGPRTRHADVVHAASVRPPLDAAGPAPRDGPRRPGGADRGQRAEEHAAAATRQHSLLPALPEVGGLPMAARYLVGADGNQVGGDWYDVLPLPDGGVGIAVGDVVGHDLAAAMGQLRGVLRSYAWDGGRPGSVLDRCEQLVQGLDTAAMATASTRGRRRRTPTATACCATRTRVIRHRCCSPARGSCAGSTTTVPR
jgi:hypothetical protein